ncbi:MAG: hypothetical protein EAZ55_07050 [Cytophagales bacterium]|nr:MAG: hypothetical protein EAZ55_07050 [Cytophagales bacterium]
MNAEKPNAQKLLTLLGIFALLFNFPMLYIGNKPFFWAGIPLLYWYIFSVWVCMIISMYFLSERRKTK